MRVFVSVDGDLERRLLLGILNVNLSGSNVNKGFIWDGLKFCFKINNLFLDYIYVHLEYVCPN